MYVAAGPTNLFLCKSELTMYENRAFLAEPYFLP